MIDNHGTIKLVHRKDVQPVEMDIATAKFFRKEREKTTTRDAKHVMPIKQIPDLNWKFDENVNQVVAREPEEGKHGEHSPCLLEIPGFTQIDHPNKVEELKEVAPEKPCLTESSQLTVKMNTGSNPNLQIEGPEQVEVTDPVAAAEPAETVEQVKTAEPVRIAEPVRTAESVEAVEPAPATKMIPTASETVCITDVSQIQEEKERELMPQSPPGSPGSPQVNGSIVNKLFSAFRPITEENPQAAPEYGLQL